MANGSTPSSTQPSRSTTAGSALSSDGTLTTGAAFADFVAATLSSRMAAFRDAFRDPRPSENTQLLLSGIIAQIFDLEDDTDISMADMTVPASSETNSDADAPPSAYPYTASGSDDMNLDGAAKMNQAKASGDSPTNTPLCRGPR